MVKVILTLVGETDTLCESFKEINCSKINGEKIGKCNRLGTIENILFHMKLDGES